MVVGLGNPGTPYRDNRHNVGFMVADALCDAASLRWEPSQRFEAELAKGRLRGRPLVLVKPQTYMNLSGTSAGPLARFYRVDPQHVVAVHDDVDLDLGRLRIKAGGGDGGHKGVRSLAQDLGSPDFVRVRVGVGRPGRGDVTDHVLGDFSAEERILAEQQVRRAAEAVLDVMARGLRHAMNTYNASPRPQSADAEPAEDNAKKNAKSDNPRRGPA